MLKCGSTNVERQIKSESRSFDEADYLCDETLEFLVTPDKLGTRKLVLQPARQRVRIITEKDGANAPLTGRYEDGT